MSHFIRLAKGKRCLNTISNLEARECIMDYFVKAHLMNMCGHDLLYPKVKKVNL